jgi:aspartyl-tRNA(Asn)/glutamyl-tRNA(Gln) amidotransferase subunit C
MALNEQEVNRVALLARLALSPEESSRLAVDLSSIIGFVQQLESAVTESVEPLAHPLDLAARLRPDVVSEPDARDRFQGIAPAAEAGLYLVPKVIE